MTNYYKQFESFKQQLKETKDIPLETFKSSMMVFFGFGGRNKTIDRWVNNFVNAKFILIKRKKDTDEWFVNIL